MTSSSLRRRIAVLLVGAFLLVPCVSAAGPRGGAEPMGFLAQLWSTLTAVWSEAGCSIDPYGCPDGTGAPESPDAGCSMDPNGRCLPGATEIPPTPSQDEGCSMDPNGRCQTGT
jgi:hypothetical protein